MYYLIQGAEPLPRLKLLIRLSRISSTHMQLALIDHYVTGFSKSHSALRNGVKKPNLSRNIKRLNQRADEKIKALDWAR